MSTKRKHKKEKKSSNPLTFEGSFLIINELTGKCIDVMDWSIEDGTGVQQFPPHGGNNQLWEFIPTSAGCFEIVAVHSGKCLDDAKFSKEDGGIVHQWSRHKGENQTWKLTPSGDGCFLISSKIGNLYLDAAPDGRTIHLWSLHGEENQKWRLERGVIKEQKTEDDSASATRADVFDNALDIHTVLAVYTSRVDLLRLECERLPWVSAAGASASLPLRSIIETHILPPLNEGNTSLDAMGEAIRLTSSRLRSFMEREFSIFCELRLHIIFEEQKTEAIGKLAERVGIEDGDFAAAQLKHSCGWGSVQFKNVQEISLVNAEAIADENFKIQKPEIEVLPGREFSFVITSKRPVICRQIRLFCGDQEVLRYRSPVHFDAECQRTVHLPAIAVAMYRHLIENSSQELTIHLHLEGRKEPVLLAQHVCYQQVVLKKKPAAVFLDVGSAYSKFMVVDIDVEPTNTTISRAELASCLSRCLNEACNGASGGVRLEGPHPTQTFVENFGLSHAPKRVLDQYEDEELAAHFSRSLSGLANRFYKRESRLISEVFWAFPNTKNRDFAKIAESINGSLGGAVMGNVHIVPEAQCLQSEFADTLNALAQAAKNATHQKETAEEENEKTNKAEQRIRRAWEGYQSRSWYEKAWIKVTGHKPTDPKHSGLSYLEIPTLEEWHREFSHLKCDAQLSDFLVFDAGGYSLDVYGAFSHGSGEVVSESFPAGSTMINAVLVDELRKKDPDRSEQYNADKAEAIKREICGNPSQSEEHTFYSLCKTHSIKVYEKHIDKVLDVVHDRVKDKGFPIILTGGGGRNQFLQILLKEKLEERGLMTVPINSPLLYITMRKAGANSPELKLFLCMANAFILSEESPRMAPFTDILGGLAQLAIKT